MNNSSTPLVKTKNLYKRFSISGDVLDQLRFERGRIVRKQEFVHAINGVTLDVQRGEALCIVGESGCGKSTVARSIMGLLSPSAGEIHYDGKRIDKLNARELLPYRKKNANDFSKSVCLIKPTHDH